MDEWAKFLAHSLGKRLDADRFGKYAQLLNKKHPLAPRRVADILLRPNRHNTESFDPQIPHYVQVLLHDDLLDVPAVLCALIKYSSFRPVEESKLEADERKEILRWVKSYTQSEGIIYGLAKLVSSGARPKATQEAVELIKALTNWTKVLAVPESVDDMMHEGHTTEAMGVLIALGALLVAASGNGKILGVLGRTCPKEKIKAFSQALAAFTPLLLHSSSTIAERLDQFRTQTLLPLDPIGKKTQAANDEIDQMIDSSLAMGIDTIPVVDFPTINSRAGLYVYLHSLLVGRPLIDDDTIFNYLHNRYQGDIQTTCIDLILASFDILANAMFRNENTQSTLLLRSFLINKVPLLLVALSNSMFPPLSPEFCITEALTHVDTNAFPNLSSMFDESSTGNMFADSVRQDFCFACCLHGLIPEESIEGLLGEIPMQTLPAGGRYIKEDLVQQCLLDPERAERLLEELERMDGNVGAVSQAVVEVTRQYCESKETMSLKILCSHLARQPSSLDVILLFDKATTILGPICELLDGWRYEEDQGEYQPVYEEFGSILLLVLAFVNRYSLSTVDLGLHTQNSFIGRLLVRGASSHSLDELSEQEKSHLDGWIRGLFNSAEGGGLGDEPMSNCPPQDFYLLVPTLFHQVALACNTGYLGDEALKDGLQYLVDTFLLPSLVGALAWLANHLWESRGDSNTVIQILQTLINPASISSDANSMLNSILNIIAKPLEHSLRWLQHNEPTRQDVEPLSKILKPRLSFSRTAASDHTELESWTNTHGGGIATSIRHTIQSLTQWSLATGMNVMPTSYTHRQILAGVRLLGAKRLLGAILQEVKTQTGSGSGAIVIDIATAIICAPDAHSTTPSTNPNQLMNMLEDTSSTPQPLQRRLTLRDALRTEAENAPKTHKSDILQAETVIRLFRRVEAMMTITIPQPGMLDHGLGALEGVDTGMEVNVGVGLGDGVLSGAQDIDDAIAAAVDQEMMDALAGAEGMMVGDEDLLGDMKLDF